jgi:hypothetical protein
VRPPDRGVGPPGSQWAGASPGAEHHHQRPAGTTHTDQGQGIVAPRLCRCNTVGRRADAWREGFGYGFRDALRLAQRKIDDPAVWVMLDRLADRYGDAADRWAS